MDNNKINTHSNEARNNAKEKRQEEPGISEDKEITLINTVDDKKSRYMLR